MKEKRLADACRTDFSQEGNVVEKCFCGSGGFAQVPRGGVSAFMHVVDHTGEGEVDDKVNECRKAEDDVHLCNAHGLPGVARQQAVSMGAYT